MHEIAKRAEHFLFFSSPIDTQNKFFHINFTQKNHTVINIYFSSIISPFLILFHLIKFFSFFMFNSFWGLEKDHFECVVDAAVDVFVS